MCLEPKNMRLSAWKFAPPLPMNQVFACNNGVQFNIYSHRRKNFIYIYIYIWRGFEPPGVHVAPPLIYRVDCFERIKKTHVINVGKESKTLLIRSKLPPSSMHCILYVDGFLLYFFYNPFSILRKVLPNYSSLTAADFTALLFCRSSIIHHNIWVISGWWSLAYSSNPHAQTSYFFG